MFDTPLKMCFFKPAINVINPHKALQLPVGPGARRPRSVGFRALSVNSDSLFEVVGEISCECVFIL